MNSLINNFVVISGFMVDGLELTGNELVVYAIIYGFCQDQQSHPIRISFLQKWIPITRQGMIKLIHGLERKKLIEIQKKGRSNWYKISQEPIDEYAKKVATEAEEMERSKKRGPSPWEKALEKAREEAGLKPKETQEPTDEKSEEIKKFIMNYDPYADDENQ